MFEVIKGINIGQGPGNAFGGGIYGASCNIGFSNEPTKIVLNVVSEKGIYQSIKPNVYSTRYNIDMNGKVFSGMYLYSYDKNKSAGQSLLTLNFMDSSLLLDKIYIGLLNRHGNQSVKTDLTSGYFSVRCPSCSEGLLTGVYGEVIRYLDSIPGGSYSKKSEDGGGYIILGKEYFPESNCEIPRVDYNFSEFCQALTDFGIKHELSVFDINPLYRQEYAGTLREVLNNWASDFSFEFFFDGNILKAIDLRRPINIDDIIEFANTSEFVTNTSFGESLENTYTQSVVARYLKPSSVTEYDNTFHFKQMANQISLSDILKNGTCAGRTGDALFISIALAKLDSALREGYIANLAIINNNPSLLEALGIKNELGAAVPYVLDQASKVEVLQKSSFFTNQKNTNYESCNPDNYAVVIGFYRESVKQAVQQWDNAAASFIGKYYSFANTVPPNRFDCPRSSDWYVYYTTNSQWSTLPQSNNYGGNALPFAEVMIDPTSQTNFNSFHNLNLFEVVDNCWGIEESTYAAAKANGDYENFRPQIISMDELPIPRLTALKTLKTKAQYSIPSTVLSALEKDSLDQNAVPAFCIIPLFSKIPGAPSISPICGRTINPSVYQRVTTRTNNDASAARCITYCDQNIVSELCNCGAQYTPVPYFSNLTAPYFKIVHANGVASNVIFPVDTPFWGYFTHSRYYKTTNPPVKKIFGEPSFEANNSLGSRIVDYDITPDIDAVMDNSDTINLFIYSPTNNQIMHADDYYASLANLNNLTVPIQKKVSLTVSKTDVQSLGIPINPANGLVSMSMSLSDGGLQTEMAFATRPPSIPKPEAIFSKIKFRLKARK